MPQVTIHFNFMEKSSMNIAPNISCRVPHKKKFSHNINR